MRALASILAILTAAILLVATAPPVFTEVRAELVSATLDPATATVGDRLSLTVVVDHDGGSIVDGPGFGTDFGGLEIVEIPPARSEPLGDRQRTTAAYTLVAFKVGTYTVPPLTFEASGADGVARIETLPLQVTIESVLQPGETDLRPLKPQLELDEQAPAPWIPVTFVALFAVLTAFGYVLVRRAIATAPASGASTPIAPPPSLRKRTRAALDELARSALAAADPPAYYARISAITRHYLSARFGFGAYAMTRRELERAMALQGIDRWPSRLTVNLLEQCDAVQFAGFRPAPERMEADLTAAYEIVELTSGHEDETAAGETAGRAGPAHTA